MTYPGHKLEPPTEWVEQTTLSGPDFPLRDRFAMQFMDRIDWMRISGDKSSGAKSRLTMALDSAYWYADMAMQARELKKETDDA